MEPLWWWLKIECRGVDFLDAGLGFKNSAAPLYKAVLLPSLDCNILVNRRVYEKNVVTAWIRVALLGLNLANVAAAEESMITCLVFNRRDIGVKIFAAAGRFRH